jgi:hypothetical protein
MKSKFLVRVQYILRKFAINVSQISLYFMDLQDYANRINSIADNVAANLQQHVALQAAMTGAALMSQRISEGYAVDNTRIGDYSKKKLYASKSAFEGRESKFNPPRNKKTMKFEDGYSGLRKYVGLQNNYVDLVSTGSLAKSIRTALYGKDAIIAIFGSDSINKAEGNEKHFKKWIFGLSNDEIDDVQEAARTVYWSLLGINQQ